MAASPSTAASPSASASGGASAPAAGGEPAQSPINDKTFIAGYNQAPDTLFAAESQSSVTSQVLVGTGFCLNQLGYKYQPTYCFDQTGFPTFENGNAVTDTVQVDPSKVSPENPIVVGGELVTDTAVAEAAGLQIPDTLNQLKLTFKLNPDLRWEDGEPVTAEDAVFAVDTLKNPEVEVASRYVYDRITNAEAQGNNTVVYTYAPGYLDRDYYTTFVGFLPQHKYGNSSIAEIREQESSHPFSFGPYMVQENIPSQQTTLVSNPYFPNQPKIGTVIFKYVTDQDQLLAQLETGAIDYAGTIGLTLSQAPRLDQLTSQGTIQTQYVPATVWEHLDFGIQRLDGQQPFFDDVKVRQAVAHAIDRGTIIRDVLYGKTKPMNTYVPEEHPSYPGNDALDPYNFDPAQAKQLLQEAGWTDTNGNGTVDKNGREFNITLYSTEGNATRLAVAEVIQQNLKQVGIGVELQFVPATAQLFKNGAEGILAGRRFDTAMYAWVSGADPSHLTYVCGQIPTPENGYAGQNNPGYCNPEFDKAAYEALGTLERDRWPEVDRSPLVIYNRDLPSLPLYQRPQIAAFKPTVTGVKIDPTSFYDLYNIQDIDITE
jgi:peptide/nickel transport system substrate-binding protein